MHSVVICSQHCESLILPNLHFTKTFPPRMLWLPFSNNCLTPTLNFKMPLKTSSLMFACHPSYHAETKGRVTLCNRIETTCLSTKVYCDVSVVFFLFITETVTQTEKMMKQLGDTVWI